MTSRDARKRDEGVSPEAALEQRLRLHGWRWDARLAWAKRAPRAATATEPAVGSGNSTGASAEALAWRRLVDPERSGTFERRLAWAGLDADRVEALLGAMEAPPDADDAWLRDLARLRKACPHAAEGPTSDLPWLRAAEASWYEDPANREHREPAPFEHLLWPLVHAQWQHLERGPEGPLAAALVPRARDAARAALLRTLSGICCHALHEACTRDRGAGYGLMLEMGAVPDAGKAPPVRYAAFCRAELCSGLGGVLDEFPVLGRLIVVACTQWAASLTEMLQRVRLDRAQLQDSFGVDPGAVLSRVQWGRSDAHRGGRSVAILTFTQAGREVRVVYKPKDVRIEAAFQALVARVSAQLPDPPIEPVSVLARDHYGYVSFVTHEPCTTDASLAAFYRNAGHLLALLYVLGASDCHYENLIAHGTSLVLIDAETLFEGLLHRATDGAGMGADPLADSVLRVGMLPTWRRHGPQIVDVSALGVRAQHKGQTKKQRWLHINTDDMVWAWGEAPMPQPQSLPVSGDAPNPFADYQAQLIEGFEQAYRRMMEPTLASQLENALRAFAGIPRRIVLRATRTYSRLQREALKAPALRDARVRGRILDQLTRSSIIRAERPPQWALCQSELYEMEQLDVPYFDFPLGSTEVRGALGSIAGVLVSDGLEDARVRLRRLSSRDLAWQVRLIRAAVQASMTSAHAAAAVEGTRGPFWTTEAVDSKARPGRTAAALKALRDAIVSASMPDRVGAPTWLTLAPVSETEVCELRLASLGLYDGLSGIAAFLFSYADRNGPDREAEALAWKAIGPVLRLIQDDDPHLRFRTFRDLGLGLTGLGGLLRLFEVLARNPCAQAVDWRALAEALADTVTPALLAKDRRLDMTAGVAGAIGPLARLYRHDPDDASATRLARAASHLLDQQDNATGGWRVASVPRPLTGFSHGTSGMGLALIEAGAALSNERLIEAGARAFAYEASVFDPEAGNWPDFRPGAKPGACFHGWCHGAPGIALARLRALQLVPNHPDADRWREQLRAGAQTTGAFPGGALDHLCCGNLGRAAILRALGVGMSESAWCSAADSITMQVVTRADRGDHFQWGLGGRYPGVDPPGLMQGLSGIGLHLLADHEQRDLLALVS